MKYAILGGSFDPIHRGHIRLAESVKEQLELDEVVLVPAAQNPLKRRTFANGKQRLDMCQLALEGHPGIVVSNVEISRGGRSFTVDTLEEFHMAVVGQAWLVMGTDALAKFVEWRQPLRVAQLARLAVVERPGKSLVAASASLPEEVRDVIDPITMRPDRVSSSDIRDAISRGESADMWLHPKVWEYIVERGLYQNK